MRLALLLPRLALALLLLPGLALGLAQAALLRLHRRRAQPLASLRSRARADVAPALLLLALRRLVLPQVARAAHLVEGLLVVEVV